MGIDTLRRNHICEKLIVMEGLFAEFAVLILCTWLISQSLKYIVKKQFSQWKSTATKIAKDTYLYYSGPPSTHTALLTSATLFLPQLLESTRDISY